MTGTGCLGQETPWAHLMPVISTDMAKTIWKMPWAPMAVTSLPQGHRFVRGHLVAV